MNTEQPRVGFSFFFSQGIGFLGLAGCTHSPSDVPACDGPVTQAEVFVQPGYEGSALAGIFFKRGLPQG